MYYPDMREYIRFLFFMLDEFSSTQETVSKRGRPKTYPDASLIVFYTVMTLKEANRLLGVDPLYTATQVATWQAARKTAIEPIFDLLAKLLSITGAHKPLPLRGVAYVSTFLGIGILLLQLSMLVNVRCGLPTRNVTHIKTVFR